MWIRWTRIQIRWTRIQIRTVSRIRDVSPGSDFFTSRIRTVSIPDPGSASKNLSILTQKKPKKWILRSRKYDPGCSSRIPDPDADFLPIPDPGVKKAPDPGSESATLDPEHCVRQFLFPRQDLFSLPASAETAKVATCWSRDTGSESEAAGSSSEE